MSPFQILQENEPARGGAQHLRHDREQRQLQRHFHYPVPEQVGPAREEGRQQGHGHPLVLPAVRRGPTQLTRRANVPTQHVRQRSEGTQDNPLPPLHNSHRHSQYRGRLQLGKRYDSQQEPRISHAAVTWILCDTAFKA